VPAPSLRSPGRHRIPRLSVLPDRLSRLYLPRLDQPRLYGLGALAI
jgi:hypothetical protein